MDSNTTSPYLFSPTSVTPAPRNVVVNTCQVPGAVSIAWFILTLMALYLSFKRNNGFSLGSFLIALFFPPIYIVYYFATQIANQGNPPYPIGPTNFSNPSYVPNSNYLTNPVYPY